MACSIKYAVNYLIRTIAVTTPILVTPLSFAEQTQGITQQVQQAINKNPKVQEKWHAFKSSIQGTEIAESGFFPTIDFNANIGYQKQNYGNSDSFSTNSAEVSLTQMLYDGFETSNNVARFENTQVVRYFELMEQANLTAFEAAKAYLDVLKFKQLTLIAKDSLKTHEGV